MHGPEIEALDAQLCVVCDVLESLAPEAWDRPTRCAPMTVRELVGHLGRVMHRFAEQLPVAEPEPPTSDRYRYWDYDQAEVGERVMREGREQTEARSDAETLAWFVKGARAAVDAGRETPADRVVRRGDRTLHAIDFCATRVLEAGVHGMDIGHATLRGEVIEPQAADVVIGILLGRLGEPLPSGLGWCDRTFILSGTGRRRLQACDRWTLGSLADRFPLVS